MSIETLIKATALQNEITQNNRLLDVLTPNEGGVVSLTINGIDTCNMSGRTKQKVLAAIREVRDELVDELKTI